MVFTDQVTIIEAYPEVHFPSKDYWQHLIVLGSLKPVDVPSMVI